MTISLFGILESCSAARPLQMSSASLSVPNSQANLQMADRQFWSEAWGGRQSVHSGVNTTILSGTGFGGGHLITHISVSILAAQDSTAPSELKIDMGSNTRCGQLSVGPLDRRFIKSVKKDDVIQLNYDLPLGVAIPPLFFLSIQLDFDAEVISSATGYEFTKAAPVPVGPLSATVSGTFAG